MQKSVSVVSPVYKAERIIDEFVAQVSNQLLTLTNDYEIILVDDGSPDNAWEKIEHQCSKNSLIKGVKLSRNFGQHYAVTAGLGQAKGHVTIVMDCDLQDDPALLPSLVSKCLEGNEIVFTKRISRKHPISKTIFATLYNLAFSLFGDKSYHVNTGSLVVFTARVREVFLSMPEKDRLYIQLLKWIGFTQTVVEVEHKPRFEGTSSYTFTKLIGLAVQGWTSHSDKLLKMSVYTGFILSTMAFLVGLYIIVQYFITGFQPGWPSLFVALMFSTGLIVSSVGITGIYISKIFQQTKDRPLFIIDKRVNID